MVKHRAKSWITTRKQGRKRVRVKVTRIGAKGKRKYAVRRLTHKGRSADRRRRSRVQPWEKRRRRRHRRR